MRSQVAATFLIAVLATSGCAVTQGLKRLDRAMERASTAASYASWRHFTFSVKATAQEALYWDATATAKDAEAAAQEGGWWGREIPVIAPALPQ